VVLPALGSPFEAVSPASADEAASSMIVAGESYWSYSARAKSDESPVTWSISGTLPNWPGSPLAAVVLLESDNQGLADYLSHEVLVDAMNP
jgi:hypothetical protein